MIGRARHLKEDRLFDHYLAERASEPVDPPTVEHLADCAACRTQYDALVTFMNGVSAEADMDLDAAFSPERLRAQQQQIAHRIDHLGHAARVISFPTSPSTGQTGIHPSRLAPRWLAAAAAAGLFIGVGVGSFFHTGMNLSRLRREPAPAAAPSTRPDAELPADAPTEPVLATNGTSNSDGNDEFLSQLEIALERPRTQELLALDELTPRIREIAVSNAVSNRVP